MEIDQVHGDALLAIRQLNEKAITRLAEGNITEAIGFADRALLMAIDHFGPNHNETNALRVDLALLLVEGNDIARAKTLLRQALEIDKLSRSVDSPYLPKILGYLSVIADVSGEYTVAENYLMQLINTQENSLGPESLDIVTSLNNLASIQAKIGKLYEAELTLTRALEVAQRKLKLHSLEVVQIQNNLGAVLMQQRKYNKAEELFLQSHHSLEIGEQTNKQLIASVRENLIILYTASGRAEKLKAFCESIDVQYGSKSCSSMR